MRPRRLCRGERKRGTAYAKEYAELQCGHGACAVENGCGQSPVARTWRASMRPRRSCRGERYCNLGTIFPYQGLQCGHGARAVENPEGRVLRGCQGMLQCGHGARAVENCSRCNRRLARESRGAVRAGGCWRNKKERTILGLIA